MSPSALGLLLLIAASGSLAHQDGASDDGDLVSGVMSDCLLGSSAPMTCLRLKVLAYLDGAEEARSHPDDTAALDEMIVRRVKRYLDTHQFQLQLPEFFFQSAVLTFRPSRGLSDFTVNFPEDDPSEDRALSAARGMLKKKLLLPVLLLLKLKMKALTPILLALVGMKALKALVLSKVAILLVVGFIVSQMLKKAGMPMPMAMPMPMSMPDQYGLPSVTPPAPPMYGPPATSSVSTQPSSSYEVSWDSGSSSGPYSRVWEPQQAAYSAYSSPSQSAYSSQQSSSQQTRRRR